MCDPSLLFLTAAKETGLSIGEAENKREERRRKESEKKKTRSGKGEREQLGRRKGKMMET